MRLYKRKDFLELPENTIYSRFSEYSLCEGLFCKLDKSKYDFVEQDLISEVGFPNNINDGHESFEFVMNKRNSFEDFETDLYCAGRDGMFDESDKFIVWNEKDILKLYNYLGNVIKCQDIFQLLESLQRFDTGAWADGCPSSNKEKDGEWVLFEDVIEIVNKFNNENKTK